MKISHLSKKYGDLEVLKNLSLCLPEQGCVCFLGPSGSGKTTLLRLLAGCEQPDSGYIQGLAGRRISMVFQEDRLLPGLSVGQNVKLVNEGWDPTALLADLGLLAAAHKPVEALSGGMGRRVALARAIAYDGDVFLMDEPFKGLDKVMKQQVMNRFKPLCLNRLVIFVTHDLSEAHELAQRLVTFTGPPLGLAKMEWI